MKMKIPFLPWSLLGAVSALLLFSGAMCQNRQSLPEPIELKYWRVWDSEEDFAQIIDAYEKKYPHVNIQYRKFTFEEYENSLKDSWALGQGPDIFPIHHSWTKKYQPFIASMPKETVMDVQKVKKTLGGAKTDVLIEKETHRQPRPEDLDALFVRPVSEDAIIDNEIYGLPLSMDTLALFFNKDLLERAHIPEPPKTWDEFTQMVPLLTKSDEDNIILEAGTALGSSSNIRRSFDILSLLMMQNHTPMISNGSVSIASQTADGITPGLQALNFYKAFSNPQKEVYSWNDEMGDSLETFNQGMLAFYFGYSFDLPTIRSRGKNIRFGISQMPQVDQEVNYPNYWLETVAKNSKYQNEAWDFLSFATSDPQVRQYLVSSKRPTALKSLITEQGQDPDLETFVIQGLTAKSWYHGQKPNDAEKIIHDLIDLAGETDEATLKALRQSQERLQVNY